MSWHSAIVGYDTIEFAVAAAVPFTSVREPRHELGRRAAEQPGLVVREPSRVRRHAAADREESR